MTNEVDLGLLAAAIEVARLARERGDHPFGAVLADEKGHMLMSAESTVVTTRDCTCGARPVEVIGPALEVEAESVHLGFWR